jgi:hypothetical protein
VCPSLSLAEVAEAANQRPATHDQEGLGVIALGEFCEEASQDQSGLHAHPRFAFIAIAGRIKGTD